MPDLHKWQIAIAANGRAWRARWRLPRDRGRRRRLGRHAGRAPDVTTPRRGWRRRDASWPSPGARPSTASGTSTWPRARTRAATFAAPVRVNAVDGDGRVERRDSAARGAPSAGGRRRARGGRGVERERPGHRDQDRAQPRLRPDVRGAGVAAGAGRRRRPRLARAHARQHGAWRTSCGSITAASPKHRRTPTRRRRGRPCAREAAESDGLAMAMKSRLHYATFGDRATPEQMLAAGRVLLLQDRARADRAPASSRRGGTSMPATCATWRLRSWARLARPRVPPASAPTAGPSTAVPTTARRSPWTPPIACTPSGPP